MNKKLLYMIGAGAMVTGGILFASGNALAYKGDPPRVGPNYTQERHEAMEMAFEKNDYNAWKSLMNGKGRVTQVINANNFNRFAEAHRLAEAGNIAEAKKIRLELGLGLNNGSNFGMGRFHSNR